jgi:prepilin-type N-terminal cleavage/methylation domain-containing protein
MNTMHKAFTLVELLIVLVIVGIMSVLLFRTFGDMTRISFRLNQEYMISQTMTQIHTTMTTLLDTYPYLT